MSDYYKAYVKVGTAYLVMTDTGLKLSESCSAHSLDSVEVFTYEEVVVKKVRPSVHCSCATVSEALATLANRVVPAVLGCSTVDKEVLVKAMVSLREAQDEYDKESVQSNP